jgi:uncharacterized protein
MGDRADVAQTIFMNDEGEMRSGWRVLAFLVLLLGALILLSTLVGALGALAPELGYFLALPPTEEGIAMRAVGFQIVNSVIKLSAALVATTIAARALEHRSFASVGFRLHRGWRMDFASGSVTGAATLSLAVAISWAAGALAFEVNTSDGLTMARNFAILFFFFLVAAAFEELLFRGFAFQALLHNLGAAAAIAITSLLFAILHLRNPNASLFSFATLNTVLAGVWLGVAYLKTRSLWLATALHYSWNFVMVFIFGLPVSGITIFADMGWLKGHDTRMTWLSGGGYGPEAGAAATAALIISTIFIRRSRSFKPSEETLAPVTNEQWPKGE